jgi:hypothetical protein
LDASARINCAGCWYAEKFLSPETLGRNLYQCLRFPPSMVAAGPNVTSMFPVVSAETVCGEYLDKSPAPLPNILEGGRS